MRTLRLLLGAFLFLICLGPVIAQDAAQAQQAPATPAAPATAAQTEEVKVPESYVTRTKKAGAVLDLSMKDAIRLALTNNLDIAIEDYNEELNRERFIQTKGFYDPRLQFTVGFNSRDQITTTILEAGQGANFVSSTTGLTLNSQIRQNVPGGGRATLQFNNNRGGTNSAFSYINPNYNSNFSLDFMQPLWRGFRVTETERQLKLVNLDTRISDTQFQDRVSSIVQNVQNEYWDLVFAIQNHETGRQSMELAIVQHKNNQKRVEIGVMAPIEITKSRAEVARREQQMIQSEVRIIEAENGLKRLLAPDPKATIWGLNLLPTDQPKEQQVGITLDEAVDRALERRPELEEIRLQVQKNEVDRKYYRNFSKPQFNLQASLASTGTAGTVFQKGTADLDGDGVPDPDQALIPAPNAPFYGGWGKAIPDAFKFNYLNYGVFLTVEMPLWRDRTNDAAMAQIIINDRRLNSQMKNSQQLVMVDVRNAYQGMQTQKKALEAARISRQLAEEQLAGENKRFEAGLSTNFEVLTYQNDLAAARVSELQALINFEKSVTALQRSMYTIVGDQDIILAKGQSAANGQPTTTK